MKRKHVMRSHKYLWAVVVLLSLCTTVVWSQNARSSENKEDIALTAGYGYEYAGFGVALENYPVDSQFGLILGAGYFPPRDIKGVSTDGTFGVGVGLRFVNGDQHRFIADVHFGLAGQAARETTTYIGTEKETDTLWGWTFAGGYQYLGQNGFVFQASLGTTYLIGKQWAKDLVGDWVPTFNLGIGFLTTEE
jgi:hypothetical protein